MFHTLLGIGRVRNPIVRSVVDPAPDDEEGSGQGQPGQDDEEGSGQRQTAQDDEEGSGQRQTAQDDEQEGSGQRQAAQDDEEGSGQGQPGQDDQQQGSGQGQPGQDDQQQGSGQGQPGQDDQQQGNGQGQPAQGAGGDWDEEDGDGAGQGADGDWDEEDGDGAGQGAGGGWDDENDGWGDPNAGDESDSRGGDQGSSDGSAAERAPGGDEFGASDSAEIGAQEPTEDVPGPHDPNAQKVDITDDIGKSQSTPYDAGQQFPTELQDDPARVFSDAELDAILDRAEREAADAIDAGVRRNTTFEALGQRLHAPLPKDAKNMTQRYRTPTGSVEDVDVGLSRTDNPSVLKELRERQPELKRTAGQLSRQIDHIREQADERVRMQTQGRLDRRRYVAAVKGTETVRKRTEEKPATSMSISVTLDFSGSMGGDIRSGRLHDATMVLSASFDGLEMPYEVRGHGDSATQYKAFDNQQFEPERSAMLSADNLGANSCTAPVMGLASNALRARDEANKLIISMTDGELSDHAETCRQLAEARRNGIVTFGVYVSRGRAPNVNKMNELYGKGNWANVQEIKDMPKAVGKRLVEVFEAIG